MKGRDLLPIAGDREARKAWEELVSREMLGAVVIGSASGKVVEKVVALVVYLILGPDASPLWIAFGRLLGWIAALYVGVYVFVFWHDVKEQVEGTADGAKEKVSDAAEGAKEKVDDVKEAAEDAVDDDS